ncbi:MAG TPA: GxxExxY protein [Planctomycetota bacterium]|nr:GxxExxY protein [Planctomycetota bacterium]
MTRTQSESKRAIAAIPPETDGVAKAVVDAAFTVHAALGPGLLESVYETCLAHEFHKRGLKFQKQLSLPIVYDGIKLEAGLRLDFVVEDCLVVEVKAVDAMIPVFQAQVLTYLKLTGHRLGLLIHFNVPVIQAGIRRLAL